MELPNHDLAEKVRHIVESYIEAWKVPFSNLDDLDSLEREELLSVVQDELGIGLDHDVIEALMMKSGFTLDDILEALEDGVMLT